MNSPPLKVLADDASQTPGIKLTKKTLAKAIHNLEQTVELESALRFAERYNAVGHDEMIYRVLQLFMSDPNQIPQYSIVIIDEFQDFNLLEATLIAQLAKKSPVLIAGDDDQALYAFKHASPKFIRLLASNPDYQRFELPYCSRCPEVVVNAANDFTKFAEDQGALKNRVQKLVVPHESKNEDSERFPHIIHAHCSVHGKRSGYTTAKYIASELRKLDIEDAKAAIDEKCLTALIIGPRNFVGPVYDELHAEFPWLQKRASQDPAVQSFDGYRMLATEEESNLGWRIVAHCKLATQAAKLASRAEEDDKRLADLLDDEFCDLHIKYALLVAKLRDGEELDSSEVAQLEGATGMSVGQIMIALGVVEGDEPMEVDESIAEAAPIANGQAVKAAHEFPLSGLCTTILSSKGLAALYVFVVGVVEGQFPKDSSSLKEKEACEFIVALTRTKWQCHLVSCKRYEGLEYGPASFLGHLDQHIQYKWVDKSVLAKLAK